MDRTLAGMALMLGFVATAPLIDVASKLASQTVPVGQITTVRFLVQGLVTLPFAGLVALRVPRPLLWPLLARAACLVVSTFAFVSAVAVMPIADALAIVFVMPFVLLFLGRLLMGDAVGPRRIAASVLGFAGSLLVMRPAWDSYGTTALWPLVTAVSFAFYMLLTRSLSPRLGPAEMQVQTSWLAVVLCLPLLGLGAASGQPALAPVWPAGLAWAWLAGVGIASALAHGLMTLALRLAPSATLAPLNYLEIVSAAALGYLVFGDWPDGPTWAGIGVIVVSGLYVIHRERVASAERRSELLPAATARRGEG